MDKVIWREGKIETFRNAMPVQFAHHLSMDRPEDHVLHINNYIEIYVFVSGNHKYVVEDRLYDLQRGDIIVINPLEVHKALPMQEGMYERFYFLMDVACLDGMVNNPLSRFLNRSGGEGNLISPLGNARARILDILYATSACFEAEKNDQLRAFGLMVQFLGELISQLQPGATQPDGGDRSPELLDRILTYVAKNTATIQSVSQIAEALGVSPQYLSAYFAKRIGTPLKIFVQAKKIALAKQLLSKGADVTGACFDSGFNDCSYFIRIFKKYVGVTPLRFKQTHTQRAIQ